MSAINDLNSVASFISSLFPQANIERQYIPETPVANTFVLRLNNDARQSDTMASMYVGRTYQVVYFGSDVQTTTDTMDKFSTACLNNQISIPIEGSTNRFIRIKDFSYGLPFKNEDKTLDVIVGMLSTEIRELREQPAYQKVAHVGFSIDSSNN